MIKRIGLALIFTISIPVIGYVVANWVLADFNDALEGRMTAGAFCQLQNVIASNQFKGACEQINHIILLRDASLYSGGAAISLIILYVICALIAGRNRRINAAIFPVLIPLSILVIAGLVLVEGAVLTYAAYIGESHAIGGVHFILIGGIGLGALVGAIALLKSLFSVKTSLEQTAFAQKIDKSAAPKLWGLVSEITQSLSSKEPDNIIVGLEPTFYATAAKTKLVTADETLTGETLFLSLPLMRLFDVDELKFVIGHELGHFRGNDTAYSLKFTPVYAGLSKAIDGLAEREGGLSSIATLPAISMLSVMHELFSVNERRISRDREFEADNAGVSVSSPAALATSLGKVAVYSHLWGNIRQQNIERLNSGKATPNLSLVFEDSAKYDVSHRSLSEVVDEILKTQIAHPTDTHPTIYERYKNIGFEKDILTVEALNTVGNSSGELIENINEIEEELTLLEHKMMFALGAATPLDEDEEDNSEAFLNAIYSLAAAMVGADGKIEQSEIQVAETIGKRLIENFDGVDFRAYCSNLGEIPDFKHIVGLMNDVLSDKWKMAIYNYLREIAFSDEEIADEEKELLVHVRSEWSLEV